MLPSCPVKYKRLFFLTILKKTSEENYKNAKSAFIHWNFIKMVTLIKKNNVLAEHFD